MIIPLWLLPAIGMAYCLYRFVFPGICSWVIAYMMILEAERIYRP